VTVTMTMTMVKTAHRVLQSLSRSGVGHLRMPFNQRGLSLIQRERELASESEFRWLASRRYGVRSWPRSLSEVQMSPATLLPPPRTLDSPLI
jgi:hypothetical protein